jgi:hypothetical protein
MSAYNFDTLKEHVGHNIVCVGYGGRGGKDYVCVSVECETCKEVILDYYRGDLIDKRN